MKQPQPQVAQLRIGDRVRFQGQVGLWKLAEPDDRPGIARARFTLAGAGSLTLSRGARLSARLEDSVTVVTPGSGRYISDLLLSKQVRPAAVQDEGELPHGALLYTPPLPAAVS